MQTGFGEKSAAVRRLLRIAQEYMARVLGLRDQKAYSRLERKDGFDEAQRESIAREFGFRSARSLEGFDLNLAIAHYEAGQDLASPSALADLITERDLLKEKISRLEHEIDRLVKMEEVLLEQLRQAKGR